MLSIAKIGAGHVAYYSAYVDEGRTDVAWLGGGVEDLALESCEPLAAFGLLAEGRAPDGSSLLRARRADHTPGWDCTFSAPKSVSLLYGLGDEPLAGVVRACHDEAVAAAVDYLERETGRSRRGTDGAAGHVAATLVVAGFAHATSRALDPQLHTHAIVLNVTNGVDGTWATLDSRGLYRHKLAAGYLYEAHLCQGLARALGADWGEVRRGIADLKGFRPGVLRAFSRRRIQIEAKLKSWGASGAKAAEAATLATRRTKVAVERTELRAEWCERASALGLDAQELRTAIGSGTAARPSADGLARAEATLVGPDGLTASQSSFTRQDVIRAWCDRLPQGATVAQVEALADHTLAHPEIVALAGATRHGDARYSTRELLGVEQRLVEHAEATRNSGIAELTPDVVEHSLAHARGGSSVQLSAEQTELVRRLTTSGAGVEVVIAGPGAGKTTACEALREAFAAGGHRVIGAALSAEAAAGLQRGSGIRSTTIARLLLALEDPRSGGLARGSVLVVDEASLVDTRTLAKLADHSARSGSKLVLVGDDRQLGAIGAGGALAALACRLDPVRLEQNWRQRETWERAAVRALREGDTAGAVASYVTHGRLTIAPTLAATRAAIVGDWWAAKESGRDAAMWARTRAEVGELNLCARARMAEAGRLRGPELVVAGRGYQAGDELVCLRNRTFAPRFDPSRHGVRNGTWAVVTKVDPGAGTLRIRTSEQHELTLPADYVRRHADHGYALTLHKSQGKTVDASFLLATGSEDAGAALVGMSRGRVSNRVYVTAGTEAATHEHLAPAPRDPLDTLVRGWGRNDAQRLALDELERPDAAGDGRRNRSRPGAPPNERWRPGAADTAQVETVDPVRDRNRRASSESPSRGRGYSRDGP